MSNKHFLSDLFLDDELDIQEDQEGVKLIKGQASYNAVVFNLTIKRNGCKTMESMIEEATVRHRPLYTGTISIIDPKTGFVMLSEMKKRKKQEAGKNYENKGIYASITFRCDTAEKSVLRDRILRAINKLMDQNRGQLKYALKFSMTPEHITLPYAVATFGGVFLKATFQHSSPDRNDRRMKTMNRVSGWIGATPICKLKVKDVKEILSSRKVTPESQELMIKFVEYLRNNGYVRSKNPFGTVSKQTRSHEEAVRKALSTPGLGDEIFFMLIFLLEKEVVSAVTVAIALMISGFSLQEVRSLTWGDIWFVKGAPDFVVVNYRRDLLLAAIHDFSRPVLPEIAVYLRKAYKILSETVKDLDQQPILSDAVSTKQISEAVNNLLVRAGYNNRLSYPGRPSGENPVPITVLEANYKRMLCKAGLEKDPDTFHFLCGNNLKNTSFTNYISHVDDAALWKCYSILKDISTEKKLRSPPAHADNGKVIARPRTTHEAAMINGKVVLKGTDKLKILCPHGVRGSIEGAEYLPEKNE